MVFHRSEDFIDKAFVKAIGELDEVAVQMEDFEELYPGQLESDKAEVDRLNSIFSQRIKDTVATHGTVNAVADQRAVILEAIFNEQVELSEWLGKDTYTIKTTEYDDFVNGTDIVIMLDGEIPIAIDVTTSSKAIPRKVDKISDGISSGKLTTIKYFEDEFTGDKGMKKGLPRFVIGAGPRTIDHLTHLWMGKRSDKKALEREPIQLQIIKEMIMQAERYAVYALKKGHVSMSDHFNKILRKLKRLLFKKQRTMPINVDIDRYTRGDKVYETIEREMQ